MNTVQVMDALSNRHDAPAWAFLPQVRSATGYVNGVRTADAIAMSLWPCRGIELHGFEVKVSRNDWVRELKNPAKAEDIAAFCDRWWIVVGHNAIVRDDELPPTWGLMVPRGNGLVVKVKAAKLTPDAIDRPFLAAILRKAAQQLVPKPRDVKVADYERGVADGKSDNRRQKERAEQDVTRVERIIDDFEKASGVKLDSWDAGRIGDAVKVILDIPRFGRVLDDTKRNVHELEGVVERGQRAIDAMELIVRSGKGKRR